MNEDTIKQLADTALKVMPFINGGMFPPSPYYRFLYELARYMKPELSVVLGVCGGGCCYNLAKAHNAPVVGIDVSNDYPRNIEFILNQHSNFHFILGDSIKFADGIVTLSKNKVDILFIDTVHTYQQTMNEFKAWYPYLSDRCVVCLDDLKRDGMMDAWDELPGDKVKIDELHIGGSEKDGSFGIIWNIK